MTGRDSTKRATAASFVRTMALAVRERFSPRVGLRGALLRAVAVAATGATTVHAERPRIAVEHTRSDAAARRLFAEVRNAGLDPVDVRGRESSWGLSELADRYRAIAVLSLRQPGRIELAVLSPETREVIYESTVTAKGGTPASVRAAEELHGRLIDLPQQAAEEKPVPVTVDLDTPPASTDEAPRTTPPEPPKPAPEEAVVEPRVEPLVARRRDPSADDASVNRARSNGEDRPMLWAGAGAGTSAAIGGPSGVPVLKVEARLEPIRYLSLSAFALLPLAAQNVSAFEGTAELRARIIGGMLHATALNIADVLRLTAGAGAGAAVVTMNGHASGPNLDGRSTSATTAIGLAAVGLSARLLPWLALRADATAGLTAYRPVMRFEGREVASWGPGTMAFTGGLEFDALGFGASR